MLKHTVAQKDAKRQRSEGHRGARRNVLYSTLNLALTENTVGTVTRLQVR